MDTSSKSLGMASSEASVTLGERQGDKTVPWYIQDEDVPQLPSPVKDFFEHYSHIPIDDVQHHILELVRVVLVSHET